MKKYILWVLTVIMTATLTLYTSPALAEQSDYVWVLVDVVDYDNAEKWKVTNENPSYQSDYSCSKGSLSVKTTFTGKAEDWRNPPKKHGEGVKVTASFSKPPERIVPNEEVNISLTVSASDNTLSFFTFGGSANADFDKPDVVPGSRGRSAIQFTNSNGENRFEVGAKNNYGTINETLTATPPAGREEGEQIALRQQFYMGVSMGTYYIYEWRGTGGQPAEKPQQNTSPKWLAQSNESVPFQGDPGMKRSGVHISDLYGEVLVELYDDDGFFVDSYTPGLGEELAVNAVIVTGPDSGVILSLRDMTTFVMKSNSEVKVGDQSETEGRIERLVGHVWCNVKQMLKDGSMDIEMSQGVCGIKGTTFILEDDGETSTVKVFEGEVEFTPLDGGNPVLVKGGNTVSVTQSETGNVQAFDMDTELANWSESVQEMTAEAMEESSQTMTTETMEESTQTMTTETVEEIKDGLSMVAVTAVVITVLLVCGILVFVLIRSRKKDSTANAQFGYNPVGQPEHRQFGVSEPVAPSRPSPERKFCKNCGKPLSANSKFCSGCGQSIT